MVQLIHNIIEYLENIILNNNIFISLLVGFLIVVLESILPFLPLAVFIAINKLVFGNVVGFLISWIGTITGCVIAFMIFRKGFSDKLYKHIKKDKYKDLMDKISNISYTALVMITALPFTAAFAVNIAAGLSKISFKKFLAAVVVAKISIVYFWGYIGTSFIESITNVWIFIRTLLIMIIVYGISKIVSIKFNIK